MKDIDFDELDRAVSSVLGQKPSTTDEEASLSAPQPAPTLASVVTPDSKSADEPVAESATPAEPVVTTVSPVEPPRVSTPLATKRRGKFMDVMHPSADMSSGTTASVLPPKQPHSINPLAPVVPSSDEALTPATTEQNDETAPAPALAHDESSSIAAAEPASPWGTLDTDTSQSAEEHKDVPGEHTDNLPMVIEPEAEDVPKDAESKTDPIPSAYVDPLDMPVQDPEAAGEDDNKAEDDVAAEPSAQSTPFLSDTKVDKRPLGAFVDNENAVSPNDSPSVEPESLASVTGTQVAPTASLPRELQPDVVDAESDRHIDEGQAVTNAAGTASPFAASVSAASTVSDDDRVEGHPLFDTSTYHEPIAATHAKSTPAWVWWLVGLGVCLAVGAGVGYFLFTAGL